MAGSRRAPDGAFDRVAGWFRRCAGLCL